ncbi:TRAP-type C4-dicarboxylate transport system substrate-binding protein [Microbacterium sp. BK668]|nr:TRAP-type C4-dicarboxylate transport system substrate-binding protein [Microbacterium sp. BK668]
MRVAGTPAILICALALLVGCDFAADYSGTKGGSGALANVHGFAVPEGRSSPTGRLAQAVALDPRGPEAGIVLEPAWDDGTPDPYREADLAEAVAQGASSFGLIPARAFDRWPEASLPALSAPFQLHSMEQAAAVARSGAVADYLSRLESVGLVGIAAIPEEIRHPASLSPLRHPDQFRALRFRTAQADALFEADLLGALGATPVADAPPSGIASGEVDAAETSLGWLPTLAGNLTITGDIDLWVKFDVLVADSEAWEALSDAQREALRAVAEDLALSPIDRDDAATRACALGYRVAVTSAAARDAFAERVSPAVRGLLADPAHAPVVEAMRDAVSAHPAREYEPPELCRPRTGDAARPDH